MKKQTQEEFIAKSKNIFGDLLDYSKVNYINSHTHVILSCKKHGDFSITPASHICYKTGCRFCNNNYYNTQIFIEKAKAIHNDKFIYDKVNFVNTKKHIIIECKNHGEFKQTPSKHLFGQGCPKCKKSSKKNLDYFLSKAKSIHNNKYDYSLVKFELMFKKVEIICPKHGSFWQIPANHINHKQGCNQCAREKTRLSLESFIKRANIIHNNKFNYTNCSYTNCVTKVEIICPRHGSFLQKPGAHLKGLGCSKCSGLNSIKENLWLDYMNVKSEHRQTLIRINKQRFSVDAYNPDTNTIYEFFGDYWHGNPQRYNPNYVNKHNKQTFLSLYKETMIRKKILENAGYKFIFIWESEFDKLVKNKSIKLSLTSKPK